MENIESSLAEICILGGVVYGMIVVPERSRILCIGIVVIFVLADASGIFGPTVKRGTC